MLFNAKKFKKYEKKITNIEKIRVLDVTKWKEDIVLGYTEKWIWTKKMKRKEYWVDVAL